MKKTDVLAAAGCVALVGASAQALGLFGGGSPTLASPLPVPLVIPIFLGVPWFVALLVPVSLFLVCVWPFLTRHTVATGLSLRTWLPLGLITAGSVAWYWFGWAYGEEYQGREYTFWSAMLSAGFFAASSVTAGIATNTRQPFWYVAAHVLIFGWFGTYAFPWLGETP
jgi:hypothetical protein